MPHHRSEPTPDTLCHRDVDELRRVLRQHVRDGLSGTPDDSWRLPARLMTGQARARAVQIEALLIALEQTSPSLAEAERLPRLESSRLLARLVTLCVEEFYAPVR